LAKDANQRGIPVTVLLIPEHQQVVRGANFGFQDELQRMLNDLGFAVFDPRDAFRGHTDPASLYLPDKHLSAVGNQLLLERLLAHLDYRNRSRLASRD
jgi:hypothetical protein